MNRSCDFSGSRQPGCPFATQRTCSPRNVRLDAGVFAGRELQHVLPRHFTRLRSFGFLANTKKRERLAAIRAALRASPPPGPTSTATPCGCPRCGVGKLVARVRLGPFTLLPLDTS
jgi:hypothetical protein